MITTKELLHKFKAFIERSEFETENPAFRMEYASKSLGLEIGYFSLSKTDLFVGGTKRGSLIKMPRKDFNGYAYCFLGDRLQIAKSIVNGEDRNITFLEYEDNYCFGYDFDYLGELIPHAAYLREHQWDRHTVIAIVADLAVTMFLAGEIRSVVPVNLILMQVLLFLGYSGARAWIHHSRAERLYF